jgi:DNA-binding Lrp family transcriptional regulator
MKLTKNEKKTLKLLMGNSRVTDCDIASKLGISSVAVGKIRRKLEDSVIESYSIRLNYAKLGIMTFGIAVARLTELGMDHGELEVEQVLMKEPHILEVYRLPRGSSTHMIIYGFRDISEFDNFFQSPRLKSSLHKYLEVRDLYTFSHNSMIKNSPDQLFHKIIDTLDDAQGEHVFKELENFKRKI